MTQEILFFVPLLKQENKAVEPRYSVSHGSAEQGLNRAGDFGAPVLLCVLDPLLPPQEGACSWLCLALVVCVCIYLNVFSPAKTGAEHSSYTGCKAVSWHMDGI